MKDKLHIGELIRKKLNEDGRMPIWLAKHIPCSPKHVYKIFEKQDIHPRQLHRISVAMKFDFFSYYSEFVRKEIGIQNGYY